MSKKAIKSLIALGKIEEALEGLIVLTCCFNKKNNKIIELSRRFEQFKINTNERLFHDDEEEWNNIIRSLIYIIDELEYSLSYKFASFFWSHLCYKKIILLLLNVKNQINDSLALITISILLWLIFGNESQQKAPITVKPTKVTTVFFYKYKFVDFDNTPYVHGILFVNGEKFVPDNSGVFFIPKKENFVNLVGKFEVDNISCYYRDLPIPNSLDSIILIKTTCP